MFPQAVFSAEAFRAQVGGDGGAGAKGDYVSVLWFRLGVIFLQRVCVQTEGLGCS